MVREATSAQPSHYRIDETRMSLPAGDYSELFLAAAEEAWAVQMGQRRGRLSDAGPMRRSIDILREARDLVVCPPQLATVVVLVDRSTSATNK
jgi:hypothetical protein